MYRTDLWTLWEKARVGCFKRTASKHVYYLGWNRSPAQVRCMWQVLGPGALGRARGIGWRGRWKKMKKKKGANFFNGLPCGSPANNLPANTGDTGSIPRLGRCPGEGIGNLFYCLVLLSGKSHGQRNLVGYSPWYCKNQSWHSDLTTDS